LRKPYIDATQNRSTEGPIRALNKTQIEKTDGLSFVYSFPIRQRDLGTDRITGKIIGVVNIDSKQKGAGVLISDDKKLAELTERMTGFSEVCSQLL